MIARAFKKDPYTALGRFCAILIGVALTWTCAIYGLLLVTASPCGDRRPRIARWRVVEVDQAIAMYLLDKDRCPGSIDDLVPGKYVSPPGTKDPWGTTFAISCSAGEWSTRSAGPDRTFGTADDVTSSY